MNTPEESGQMDCIKTLGGLIDGWLVEYLFDPTSGKASLAYRDPNRGIGSADHLVINGKRYEPEEPGRFIREGGVLFASELGEAVSTRELFDQVIEFISRNFLLTPLFAKLAAYYVMMTWLYDCFEALPYLCTVGGVGVGKTELMRRVGHLCYRLLTSSGASSEASFFRATEMYRGTVFIDEADLADDGDMSNALVKFLNAGAMKGTPIMRLEEVTTLDGGRTYETAVFHTFGPKLIAMRREFRDAAVRSRCITIQLQPREPIELSNCHIKMSIDGDFRRQAVWIRNQLLRWRMERWQREIPTEDFCDLMLPVRLNQVTLPLKAVVGDDHELVDDITVILRDDRHSVHK